MNNALVIQMLLVGLLANTSAVHAAEAEGAIRLSGTLIVPPQCTINDGGRVNVDFGDKVGVNTVDGDNHRQPLNYQITCGKSTSTSWLMKLTLSGDVASFDNNALKTDQGNLSIQIYQDDKRLALGKPLAIDLSSPPKLEARLVKKTGAILKEGKFESWATLKADYQ